MIVLAKKFRFEAAHRISKGYSGKCANIHGHSWNGEIRIKCPGLDPMDMGVDYAKLKEHTKWIDDELDHALILFSGDPFLLLGYDGKIFEMGENPTSETLAKLIFKETDRRLSEDESVPQGVSLHCVTIEETCTTRCEYYGE